MSKYTKRRKKLKAHDRQTTTTAGKGKRLVRRGGRS